MIDYQVNTEDLLRLYRTMARIRAFEDAAERASVGGVAVFGAQAKGDAAIRGPLHLSTGQEAVAAGVCFWLTRDDYVTSTHRGHGHVLAKGADTKAMMAELFGRATGTNGGKAGSMHLADLDLGILGANGIVAAGINIAVGAAHAVKIRNRPQVVVCFFGDGAVNRGPFLEGLNWAVVYGLPILFVCEDNQYAATTRSDIFTGGGGPAARAASLGLTVASVDGNDVLQVAETAREMTARLRAGGDPQFLHARTYRIKGHVSVDQGKYRHPEEALIARLRDPFKLAEKELTRRGAAAADLKAIHAAAEAEIAAAVAAAAEAPYPPREQAYEHLQECGAGLWR